MTAKELRAKLAKIPDDANIDLVIRHPTEAWSGLALDLITPGGHPVLIATLEKVKIGGNPWRSK